MNKRIKEFISIMKSRNTTLLEMISSRKDLTERDIDLFSHIGVAFKYQNEEDAKLLSIEKEANSLESVPPLKFSFNAERSYKINIFTSKEDSYNRYTILSNGNKLSEILVIRRLKDDYEIGVVKVKITNLPDNMQRFDKNENFYKYSERKNQKTSPEEFFKEIIMSNFFYDIRREEVDFILDIGF